MAKVTQEEIIQTLFASGEPSLYSQRYDLAKRIQAEGIAPPDGCEVVSYFYSGPQGFFYVPTMGQGEIILSLMNVDEEDWTATKLATLPSVDELIAEIMDCEINGHYGDTGYDVGQVNAVIDKYRSAK